VTGVLRDFAARGKLNIICTDSDFMMLVQSNNLTKDAHKLFFRELKAAMNWRYKNTTTMFSGVISLEYLIYVEGTDPNLCYPKKTCLRREIRGIRLPNSTPNLFVGVMECSGEQEGSISCAYYEDETNENFINTCISMATSALCSTSTLLTSGSTLLVW
jgi:hypothetical protein